MCIQVDSYRSPTKLVWDHVLSKGWSIGPCSQWLLVINNAITGALDGGGGGVPNVACRF